MRNSDDQPSHSAHQHDQRQYRRMLQRLESFEAGDDVRAGLAGDLGTLLLALQAKPDRKWTRAFSSLCGELDIIDSVAAYRAETKSSNRRAFGEEELLRARDIAASLKRLVLARVEPSSVPRPSPGAVSSAFRRR
jgi:hypothetical protein